MHAVEAQIKEQQVSRTMTVTTASLVVLRTSLLFLFLHCISLINLLFSFLSTFHRPGYSRLLQRCTSLPFVRSYHQKTRPSLVRPSTPSLVEPLQQAHQKGGYHFDHHRHHLLLEGPAYSFVVIILDAYGLGHSFLVQLKE